MTPLYTARATVHGGRDGKGRTDDGKIDVVLNTPKEMGGGGGAGTNPEQLFAVGYAACFEGAVRAVARSQHKAVAEGTSISSAVTFNKLPDNGGFALSVKLIGTFPTLAKADALALMEAAHQVCPYSRATRGNIPVELSVAE
jgi:Ohr subfamily peroxiredoxin